MALGISIFYDKVTYAALQRAADALRVDEPGEADIVDTLLSRIDLAREHAEAVVGALEAARDHDYDHGRTAWTAGLRSPAQVAEAAGLTEGEARRALHALSARGHIEGGDGGPDLWRAHP
jgi:hypothetical protein